MSNKPNINLRVFRREKTDMTLIFNKTELSLPSKFEYELQVLIEGKKIHYIEEEAKSRDNSSGDVCIFIPYQEKMEEKELKQNFSIVDFKKAKTKLNVIVGRTRIELNEIDYTMETHPVISKSLSIVFNGKIIKVA